MNFICDKIERICETLKSNMILSRTSVSDIYYSKCDYKTDNTLPKREDMQPFDTNLNISGRDSHYWFNLKFKTPKKPKQDSKMYFSLITGKEGEWDGLNPQGLVYINSEIVQGLDTNHTELLLEFDKEYDMYIYFYIGMIEGAVRFLPSLYVQDEKTKELYYDLYVPLRAAQCQDPTSDEHIAIIKALDVALMNLDLRKFGSDVYYESVDKTRKALEEDFYKKICGDNGKTVSCIGHTHIDIAWLWTLMQTREKAQRSFSTVLNLMEQYPEYKFMSSQPHLYENVKEEAPELYERIKQAVKDGRWEVEGAMWCEADCNLISGESFVRQIMHGKRFIKEEFDKDSEILWLPDVFGYSAAMPQILKKCGVNKFVTSKISWNESNKMPFENFMWEGIDGTEIFTEFMTAQDYKYDRPIENYSTYVGYIRPEQILGTHKRYTLKEYNNETLLTFGFGDGGGGPTADMLEQQRRLSRGLPGIPKTEIKFATKHLENVYNNFKEASKQLRHIPKWCGELYLEYHRGTYTSIAKNKKNNRTSELLYQKAETAGVFDKLLCGTEYNRDVYYNGWRGIVTNQFHDIIPGSSIFEVYEQSDIDYKKIIDAGTNEFNKSINSIMSNINTDGGTFVYNPNGFCVSDVVEKDGKYVYVKDVAPFGYCVTNPVETCSVTATKDKVESKNYIMKLDEFGNIISLFDKMLNIELVAEGQKLNELKAYEDIPRAHDAWELSSYYKEKPYEFTDNVTVKPVNYGAAAGVEITRPFFDSKIVQTILLYDDVRRIDVKTEIDWNNEHTLLKAHFPLNVHAQKATYDIQFGNVERNIHENTSWDAAKFEVCAHKWADISEDGYGVSILNNCKYGYSCLGNEMTLSLLKCATDPNPHADKGHHSFTYSIFPHKGNFKEGATVREAYKLNQKLALRDISKQSGSLADKMSMINCDRENIVIETVKLAEDDNSIIIRLYDAFNSKSSPVISFNFDVKNAYICDMLENSQTKLDVTDKRSVKIDVSNYEIVTLKLEI